MQCDLALIAVITLLQAASPGAKVRLGEFEVSAFLPESVPAAAEAALRQRKLRSGYHFVLVGVRVKNIDVRPSCTDFTPWLRVDLEFEYERVSVRGIDGPRLISLPSSEEVTGTYVFETKDGTAPAALVLVRDPFAETVCRTLKNLPNDIPGPRKGVITLAPSKPVQP